MMMTSAVVTAPRSVALRQRPLAELAPTSLRVRLEGCGMCGSNLPVWEGRPWFRYPLAPGAPGHEGWGVVDAIGSDVAEVRPGDRVALLSEHAFAEFDVVEASRVARLPPSLDGKPFPGEALSCAMNVFRRSDIQPHQTVAVVGVGFLGALLTRLASRAGARVLALSRRPFALAMARTFGAAEVIATTDAHRAANEVKELTGGRGCECVIEAAGHQATLDLASEICGERGRLVIAGYHQDGSRRVNMQSWNWRGLDVINAHEREPKVYIDGLRAAIAAVAGGELDPAPLYTHQFPLHELGRAFDALRERPPEFMKALVAYE